MKSHRDSDVLCASFETVAWGGSGPQAVVSILPAALSNQASGAPRVPCHPLAPAGLGKLVTVWELIDSPPPFFLHPFPITCSWREAFLLPICHFLGISSEETQGPNRPRNVVRDPSAAQSSKASFLSNLDRATGKQRQLELKFLAKS